MQILDLVFYSHDNRQKILSFKTGSVNIITGISSTGKTALAEVIDYCLGKKECTIPERGPFRNSVSWFGIRIQFKDEQYFIARKNPGPLASKDARCHLIIGENVDIPKQKPEHTSNSQSVINILSSKLGIIPNLKLPWPNIHHPTTISIREALTYCYQQQDKIASKTTLFHRQEEQYRHQIIKHSFPYFLGAIPDDVVKINFDLLRSRREIERLYQDLREASAIQGEGIKKAARLFAESQISGLVSVDDDPSKLDDYITILRQISDWSPEKITLPGESKLDELQQEAISLRRDLDDMDEKISVAKEHESDFLEYKNELNYEQSRLKPIGIFEKLNGESKICPFCGNDLKHKVAVLDAISKSIEELDSTLKKVSYQQPDIQRYIQELENKKDHIINDINTNAEKIRGILNYHEEMKKLQSIILQKAQVVAKIKFWLESVDLAYSESDLKKEISEKEYHIEQLENMLNEDKIWTNVYSILRRINALITKWAQGMELELSNYPMRLDPHQLTLIVEGDEEYHDTPLRNVGSGRNWLGYHIITHLALHEYFLKKKLPVPHFLFLDQPSQVYFSNEKGDYDYNNVYDLYDFLVSTSNEIGKDFQLIVTDHAKFMDKPYLRDLIRAELTEEEKIIPEDWPPSTVNV